MRPYRWSSAKLFTMFVTLDLRLSGSSGAWSEGRNDRFVAFHRSEQQSTYLLEFNCSP